MNIIYFVIIDSKCCVLCSLKSIKTLKSDPNYICIMWFKIQLISDFWNETVWMVRLDFKLFFFLVQVSTYMQYHKKGISCCIRMSHGIWWRQYHDYSNQQTYPILITLAQQTDFTCKMTIPSMSLKIRFEKQKICVQCKQRHQTRPIRNHLATPQQPHSNRLKNTQNTL